ncbi:Alpha/Beta hydrolase protein, partial [Vararia minispora EC-137]
ITVFADPLQRIRTGLTARKPIIIGNTEDDGTFFTFGQTNLTAFLHSTIGGLVPADVVRSLYPGMNDTEIIADAIRDLVFRCPASLWGAAFVESGVPDVFRYSYGDIFMSRRRPVLILMICKGAIFADTQVFPGAGAWHASELPELFGTFNASTATPNEVTLSSTFQAAFANFIKDPTSSPARGWPKYVPGNSTQTLAKIAYMDNVKPNDFVQ